MRPTPFAAASRGCLRGGGLSGSTASARPQPGRPGLRKLFAGHLGASAVEEVVHHHESARLLASGLAVAANPCGCRDVTPALPRLQEGVRIDRRAVVRVDLEVEVRWGLLRVAG